jgi:uncharacterized protein YfdQ (DUF2303 family)
MMNQEAIKELQKGAAITQANQPLDHTTGAVALPKDFELHNLERFESNRYRFRGQMATKSVIAFSQYATDNAQEDNSCFIDAKSMCAKLIFNVGNQSAPGHCDHIAVVSLEKTAPYTAMLDIVNKRHSQKDIAEFIEDWRNYITAHSEEDENGDSKTITLPRALHAIRKITIEATAKSESETRNFGASTSSMESIDVKGENLPPATLLFTCKPYAELPERQFALRLSVITDRTPLLILRCVREEEHAEEMASQFKELLTKELGTVTPSVKTYIGSFTA